MKIGLLGGSFNPVHNGHLAISQAAYTALGLDAVWFLPTGNHPLKRGEELWPYSLRKNLLQKALTPFPHFVLSELDANSTNPSFTSNLIESLQHSHPADIFYFIIGYDIVPDLPRWHRFPWLITHTHFAVFTRPGFDPDSLKALPYARHLRFFAMPPIHISSTDIRQALKRGEAVAHLLPPGVADAIQQGR
ncbi:MAG: nicotinate (nicotinamide) nucleotide adenylyltransferase [Candidatus Cloacimonetes bacterium]|nr:nicotinate (nicotinamide) nucleotide adenylyltransferase [Candidatus Cloacimonadota bacterium]